MEDDGRLNSHQRDTMAHIFRHPLSHNIEWHAVLSLLEAVATVHETHSGHYQVTLGSESESFERPRQKDISAEQFASLRRLLRSAGYGPGKTRRNPPRPMARPPARLAVGSSTADMKPWGAGNLLASIGRAITPLRDGRHE